MSNEIIIPDELPVLMKSGLVHWLKIPTWEKISAALAGQSAHQFIRISELGNIVINTSEVEGAYTMQQFEDHCKVKEGQWQCAYRVWHPRRGECSCKAEYLQNQKRAAEAARRAEEGRPLTEEERAERSNSLRTAEEMGALNGMPIFRSRFRIGMREPKAIRRSTIEKWKEKNPDREPDLADLLINEKE